MSNRVLVYRVGSQPKMKALVFWTSPRVSVAEVSDAIREFAEIEGPVGEVCLLSWHHCTSLFEKLLDSPLDLRVQQQNISGALLGQDLKWQATNLKQSTVKQFLLFGYEWLTERRGGILTAPDGYHYEKPSGIHSKKFLRAANLFLNSNESALFAIGLLTQLNLAKAPEIIYTDTSAINVVGHMISDFYIGEGIPMPIPVVSFGSYEGLDNGFDFDFTDTALVVMSATTSGSLEKKLIKEYEIPGSRICTLFAANGIEGSSVLFNVSKLENEPFGPIENHPAGKCPMCDQGEPVITISGDQFLPEPATSRPFEILKKDLRGTSSRLVNDLSNGKVVCNYRTKDNKRQVFSFELFKNKPECRAETEIKRQFGLLFGNRNNNVLVPQDSENLSWTSNEHCVACTERLEDVEKQSVIGVFCPLNYHSGVASSLALELRRLPDDPPRSFLLGISIYSGSEEEKETKTNIRFRKAGWSYLVESVYDIFLPRQRNGKTPWDLELRWLFKSSGVVGDEACIQARIALLNNEKTLEDGNLFLPDFKNNPLPSTKGFAFFEDEMRVGDQASILLTISLALHDRRRANKSWSSPQNREVIEPRMFNRYTDPAIQAAILRSALPEELNYSGSQELSARFAQIVDSMIAGKGVGNGAALGEFCYAILSERVRLDGHVREQTLEKINGLDAQSSPWAKCFANLAAHQLK